MRHLILLICLCIAGIAMAQPYKVEDDFTKGTVRTVTGKGKFSGVLPPSWIPDFPGWNSCVARGELVNEGPENFLRIHVDKLDSQRVQLARPISPLSKEARYRLTIQYRNRTNDNAELLIRQQSGSYSTFWKTRLPVTREWKKMTFYPELSQKPEWKGMGIYLYLGSAGTFDIVSLRLEECSAEEAANAGAKIFRPSPDLPNFLRNSRLPFGPQSGWNFDRKAAPDWRISEEPGPSGAPYLTFRDTSLSSEPFQVAEPGQEHFISFSYKGKGKAVIPWRTVELPQSDSWKRVVLPILPGASLKGFSFILIADGALSVDAFQVSRRRGEYSSAGECEVALALPESQTANARIQFEDEPPEIRYLLTGKTDGVELAVTVADLYGRADSFTVAPKAPAGTIAFNRFPDAPRGQFRVEVQARKDGKAVSPINELVVTRLSRPKYWGKFAPNSPFGIHALPNAQTLLTLKAGGINATRLHGDHDLGRMLRVGEALLKGRADLHEREYIGDHPFEVDAVFFEKADVFRIFRRGEVERPDQRALHPFRQIEIPFEPDVGADFAAFLRTFEDGFGRLRVADEGVGLVRALPAAEPGDFGDHVALTRIDGVVGAEFLRLLPARADGVDSDDLADSFRLEKHHLQESERTEAPDRHRVGRGGRQAAQSAQRHPDRVGEQRGGDKIRVLRAGEQQVGGEQRILLESPFDELRRIAAGGDAVFAAFAHPAPLDRIADDAVADPVAVGAGAAGFDDSGRFVAVDRFGVGGGVVPPSVRPADGAGFDADQVLPGAGNRFRGFADGDLSGSGMKCAFHDFTPYTR